MDPLSLASVASSVALVAIGLALLLRAPVWGLLAALTGAASLAVWTLLQVPSLAGAAAYATLALWPAAFVAAALAALRASAGLPGRLPRVILVVAGAAALASAVPFVGMEVEGPPVRVAAERVADASFAAYACAIAALVALLARRHALGGEGSSAAAWLAFACAALAGVARGQYLVLFEGALSDVLPIGLLVAAALLWARSVGEDAARARNVALAIAALPLAGALAAGAPEARAVAIPSGRMLAAVVLMTLLRP